MDNRRNYNPMNEEQTSITVQLDYIQRDIAEIKESLKADYTKREEFLPVKNIVYGMISVILVAVVGALIALVIKQ